jgi:hypothetical protein
MEELKTEPVLEYTGKQKRNWRDHVNRMDGRSIPKLILQYAVRGGSCTERPAKKGGSRP